MCKKHGETKRYKNGKCSECSRAACRKWIQKNPEYFPSYHRNRSYGLTPEQHQSMIESQQGKCAICEAKSTLVVDHCHSTSRIRGLLCQPCNKLLGHASDNIGTLKKAIAYLKKA